MTAAVPPALATARVLVVDDNHANLKFILSFLEQQGFEVITAASGHEALALFESTTPDLILMDIMLPDMDGRNVTREIKRRCGDHWVPVIYMTALAAEADEIRGLEAGGDDYITKPVNLHVLKARINAMQRIAEVHRRLADTTRELKRYQTRAEHEQSMAEELMARLIYHDRLNDPMLQTWHAPATRFSGDLMAATRSTGDRLYIMVADSTGHGLAAALPLLHLSQIFYAMADRGFSLTTMVTEMNNKTLARMPIDRFVCGVLAVIDPHNRLIEIWSGGSPPAYFLDAAGEIRHQFASRHMPLGVEPPEGFDCRTEIYQWDAAGQLVIFTDGAVDAQNAKGQPLGEDALLQTLRAAPMPERHARLVDAIRRQVGEASPHDDISLLLVHCGASA